ncbi:CDP-glycerol glycerophosphotransferase family protein [Isoptericola dokdonensis]|uniref:CDP-glycerol glycerophosphotransferase family protein n=1 Tax=Isoptericola dokdonensis TaxID=372663 RepID=UPI0012FA5CB3|nr:CDP-glycerol glycerophosphotransferase family protein [Isoptericola dokdonensis]
MLVDRSAADELVVRMTIADDVASAELSAAALTLLGAEVLDLWVEVMPEEGGPVRRRVAVDREGWDTELAAVSTAEARWYRTVNGRLSVAVAGAGVGVDGGPSVARLADAPGAVELALRLGDVVGDELSLTFRGRTSGLAVEIPVPESLDVEVAHPEVFPLGRQLGDLFLSTPAPGGAVLRRRLRVDTDLDPARASHGLWRWSADAAGRLSVRRATPAETIADSGIFDEEFYRRQVPGLPATVDAVEHYVARGAADGLDPSPMFDTRYYRRAYPDARRVNPLAHYCDFGWRELRNPSPQFDTWWYWSKHLDPAVEDVNPLAHHAASGGAAGLSTRPSRTPSRELGPGYRLPTDRPVRRVCLFAAYDVDGIVDDYVVDYVRELSRFADVYYLADSVMAASELAKLEGVTKGAWAQRHGEYDFGSYRRLAERVGWDVLETYDELLLVNDSCYLLRPLDEVFARMDARACDWWGLQATKGLARTRTAAERLFRAPIPMDSVRYSMIDRFEDDDTYDFHVASYFLAYRTPVLRDPEFRRYLGSVTAQRSKIAIIQKYEIGLTRWLVHHGHAFDTFVTSLYPFHPIFSRWHFTLLDEGFPLLKRFFLTENHYYVPRLKDWTDRVLAVAPDAPVATFERNLRRITDPQKLRASLWIGTEEGVEDPPVPEQRLTPSEFVVADRLSPKHADWWAFPVCAFTENFSGNERAVFEQVKDDPAIRKIVLTRGKEIVVDGVNVDVVPLESPEGQHLLMRSGVILVKHSVARNAVHPVSAELHNIIQVWHGVPFKRIAYASEDFKHMLDAVAAEQSQYRAVIASSRIDSFAMAASFFPLTHGQVWTTGLPRNDFVLQDEQELAPDLSAELHRLRALLAGRRLVLFMPTFRNAQAEAYYRFEPSELEWLGRWLEENNCVLGLREHMADSARVYGTQLAGLPVLDLSDAHFVHPELLYRAADLLITDYSSAFIDYMLTGKPAVSFAFDLESYEIERGGYYDLDQVFPGPIARDFGELREALEDVFDREADPTYALKRKLLHDHVDADSSARVVERIRDLGQQSGLGTWSGERVA